MKIGLFFGTFNPVHNGHLMMANYIANNTDIDEVWFVVNPTAPFKKNDNLLDYDLRTQMIDLSTMNHNDCSLIEFVSQRNNIRKCCIEKEMSHPTYTYNTLMKLKEVYGDDMEFVLIIGSDNLINILSWKNADFIIANYEIYVCPRNNVDCNEMINRYKRGMDIKGMKFISDVPECNLSSTFIRSQIKNKKSIDYYVPKLVSEFIENNKLYK